MYYYITPDVKNLEKLLNFKKFNNLNFELILYMKIGL